MDGFEAFALPSMPDTSAPGPTPLQAPVWWIYDFDPATGISRATFLGEVSFTSGGPTTPVVASFNSRTGAVILGSADLTAAGGALLAGPAFTGSPTAPTAALSNSSLQLATTAFVRTGVSDGSNAGAGQVGEFLTASIPSTSPVTLATGVLINITTLPVTAGDWDMWGSIGYGLTGTTTVTLRGGANTVSATLPADVFQYVQGAAPGSIVATLPAQRLSLSASATLYLVASATFTTGSVVAYGMISARRRR